MKTALAWIGAACLACILVLAGTFAAGLFNVGADEPHLAAVESSIGWVRQRSISAVVERSKVVLPSDRASLQDGAQHYAAMCAGCHLSPGGSTMRCIPGRQTSRASGSIPTSRSG